MVLSLSGVSRLSMGLSAVALALAGCVDGSPTLSGDGSGDSAGSSTGPIVEDVTGMPPVPPEVTTTATTSPATTEPPADSSGLPPDESSGSGAPGCGDAPCPTHSLDVVFVVDNTPGMGFSQQRLAEAADDLLAQLDQLQAQYGVLFDLHLMVTTSDFGNPLCTPFAPKGYDRARGRPISTACTERLDDFTSLTGTIEMSEACLDVCPAGVAPEDPFIASAGSESNVPDGMVAEALGCLLPQGINGCGYESPLENMLQALNPAARWNTGGDPFLRDGADLALVVVTNEEDCSVQDYSIMEDSEGWNTNPNTMMPQASSALCWNHGVSCDGPDGSGIYSNCVAGGSGGLQPVERYTSYLLDQLVAVDGKNVMMLALTGVPSVVEHSARVPYEPTIGGVDDLVIREWIDGPYPAGDILPSDAAAGVDASYKAWEFGPGPGCTSIDGFGRESQGVPSVRIQEVCHALDQPDSIRCCMESMCDEDYGTAMMCLSGMIAQDLQ